MSASTDREPRASKRIVAPWPGDEHLPYLQGGIETSEGRTLWLSGTGAVERGEVRHPDDVVRQAIVSLEKTGLALQAAGYEWGDVVRLNWYIKDTQRERFTAEGFAAVSAFLAGVGCKASGVLLYVSGFAFEEMLCEFEATTAK